MFSTIDEIFHNHTISFQQTVTILSLSNYHSPGADPHQPHSNTPKILLTFQKNFISSYQILRETSFTDLQTYQSTSNLHAFHFTHLNEPLNTQLYCTTQTSLTQKWKTLTCA